jgi:protein-tyrosine phosphatase
MTPLHWIPGTSIAIAARPRGGDWLEDELKAWKAAGVTTVVSLLEPVEADDLDLDTEAELAESLKLHFVCIPLQDRGVPMNPIVFGDHVQSLNSRLDTGERMVIHCRQGVGRAGLTAAALLIDQGRSAADAIAAVSAARKVGIPETPAQTRWLHAFAQSLSPADAP